MFTLAAKVCEEPRSIKNVLETIKLLMELKMNIVKYAIMTFFLLTLI